MTPEERYREAAREYASKLPLKNASFEDFLAGCAHAEKEAYNRALDDALMIVLAAQYKEHGEIIEELEKLKL